MAKKRVYELAQELGRQNKEIMDFLKSRGVDVMLSHHLIQCSRTQPGCKR